MNPDPRYLLLADAGLLIRQWRSRDAPAAPLSDLEREAWGTEAAAVLLALGRELQALLPDDPTPKDTSREWDVEVVRGNRRVQYRGVMKAGSGTVPHQSGYPESWPLEERQRFTQLRDRATAVLGDGRAGVWIHRMDPALGWVCPGDVARGSEAGLLRMLALVGAQQGEVPPKDPRWPKARRRR